MHFIVYFILTLMTITSIVKSLTVKVKRADGESDRLEFTSTDISICSKYNAVYDYKTSYTVHCKCTSTNPSFYSISTTSQPTCHHSNAENLGCGSCASNCVSHINNDYTNNYVFSWESYSEKFACTNGMGLYLMKKWDGTTWNDFYKFLDFKLKFSRVGSKTVVTFELFCGEQSFFSGHYEQSEKINPNQRSDSYNRCKMNKQADVFSYARQRMVNRWNPLYSATKLLKAYAGHLFLITSYCLTIKMNCFLASANGERLFDILDAPTIAPPTKVLPTSRTATTTKPTTTKSTTTKPTTIKATSTKEVPTKSPPSKAQSTEARPTKEPPSPKAASTSSTNIIIGVSVVLVVVLIILIVICCVWVNKRNKKSKARKEQQQSSTTHTQPPPSPSFKEATAPPFVLPSTHEVQPQPYSQQQFDFQPPQQMFSQPPITHQQPPPPQLPPYQTVTDIPAISPVLVMQQPIVYSTHNPVQITPNNNVMYTTSAQPIAYMQQPKKNKKPRRGGNIAPRIVNGVVENAVDSFVESTISEGAASGFGGMLGSLFG